MVKRIGLLILVLGLAVIGPGFGDKAGPDDDVVPNDNPETGPLEMVTSSVSHGLASLRSPRVGFNTGEERRAEIRRAAADFFDVGDIARRALGQHWKGLGARDRHEFVELFRAALTRSFVTVLERYGGDHVASVDEEVAGVFARVRSRITPSQGLETRIEYRLSRSGSQWTVYDIVLDGVSLVSSLRSQLSAIIGTSSVPQFLERMRTKPSWRPLPPDVMASTTVAEARAVRPGAWRRWPPSTRRSIISTLAVIPQEVPQPFIDASRDLSHRASRLACCL